MALEKKNKNRKFEKACKHCSTTFIGLKKQMCCSRTCGASSWKRKKKDINKVGPKKFLYECKFCNIDFKGKRYQKFCSVKCFNLWAPRNINKYKKSPPHRKKIGLSQKGIKKPRQTKEHSKKISVARKGMKFSVEHRANLSKSKVNSMNNKFTFGGKQSRYISTKTSEDNFSHSSYELKRMKFLDNNNDVIYWTKNHGLNIEYTLNGITRRYIPDFVVEWSDGRKTLEEVKGWVRNKKTFEAKNKSAVKFANENEMSFRVLFFDDLEVTQ